MKARTTTEFDWQEKYKDRISTAAAAMQLIKPGSHVFIGTGCAQPQYLVNALMEHTPNAHDVRVFHMSTMGTAPYADEKYRDKFKLNTFFVAENVRGAMAKGIGDYTPIFMSDLPQEFAEGRIPIDVALITVSPPDSRGQCSLGISVDVVRSAVANANYVVAQVNPNMPRTLGNSFVHINQIDFLVPHAEPVIEAPADKLDDTLRKLGENVARLIEDGSTIECGIGSVAQAVAEFLKDKKDLGIHSEMFSDWIIPLVESGAVNCSKKRLNRGKIVASFCMGTRKLYDFINNNAMFELHPTEYVNDPFIISQLDKMVAINTALEVDLTGQVCADSLGHQLYSGVGGQVDFGRGAARSRGGKPIIALPSTAKNGTVSRIVPNLAEGAGVVTTRADVHYVVTENGVAYLHGKSIRERAMALIGIAHPKFRKQLIQAAKAQGFLYEDQIEIAWEKVRYPEELEQRASLKDGTEISVRPVKPTDEGALSEMLYSLSVDSVKSRFFTSTKTFPHKDVQHLTNIDYEQNLAIVGSVPGTAGEEQIVAIGQYFLDPKTQAAEVAFIVQDVWQLKGMGSILMKHLANIAKQRGVKRFTAKVLPQNKPMLAIFQNSGYAVRTDFDGESYSVVLELGKLVEA
jgi:acyl-CoA hydrolase/GNAT superfamily N-acetyltransferase